MIPDPSSPKTELPLCIGVVTASPIELNEYWAKWSDVQPRLAQLEQQLAAANDERRALKLAVFNGDEAKMQTFPTEQILRLIACYREDTEIMDALHEEDGEAGLIALRERLQAKEQRLAQLAQEQATLQAKLDRAEALYSIVANGRQFTLDLLNKSEAALGETRQALHQFYLELRAIIKTDQSDPDCVTAMEDAIDRHSQFADPVPLQRPA